ncbi:acyl-phosphate glycerol 3-phosphate acyltransferase [Elstera litoralis]|uniref:Acyl-phosphate glycerol 3-phosphate acyltransferase n=1 Tax=Elstera litoralis TaxID=552518 RepID=A0A0F3ITD3_9PROT|nr:lysophospholipid acyltransferase family protein [Elstera litoralis]KJV09808.1 acyl-phosphate glycerol 3-phosphate acyltransferase [Elstera litoralis]
MGDMMAGIGSFPLAVSRLLVYLGFTFLCMPVQIVAIALGTSFRTRFPVWYHRRCLRLLGVQIEATGARSTLHPTLFIANHGGYIDISLLGALIPGSFVAKSEVGTWPLFGWLAKLQRTVFVDRKRGSTHTQRDDISSRLHAGDNLILFPEGTSSDGNRVLPFKSALFSVAALETGHGPLVVQPVSIAYTKINGIPMGRALRPFLAWYGDMGLGPHLLRLAGLGKITVAVTFHPPVTLAQLRSRKALAGHCQSVIAESLAAALSGRAPIPPSSPTATVSE